MFKSLLISSVIFASGNLAILPVMAETQPSTVTESTTSETTPTENPPAETFQPGFWQPVARVDMTKPVTLKIINDSGILLYKTYLQLLTIAFTFCFIQSSRLDTVHRR